MVRRTVSDGSSDCERQPRRVLLIVTPVRMHDCFVHAIERQFQPIRVVQTPTNEAACRLLLDAVSLTLVDNALLADMEEGLAELQRIYPSSTFALLQSEASRPVAIGDVLAVPRLNGVLPMDLKLDLWLSVLQILLQGGTYIPPPLIAASVRHQNPCARSGNGVRRPGRRPGDRLGILTDREFEILALVSQGLQNKLIAGRLGLSENTIKIHLHNIITKLGTHNRTEAAGLFRDHAAMPRPRPGADHLSRNL